VLASQFALSVVGIPEAELCKLIERHGGEVLTKVRKAHVLVATELAIQRQAKEVRAAQKWQIPLVSPSVIHDSLRAGEMPDLEEYRHRLPSAPHLTVAAAPSRPATMTTSTQPTAPVGTCADDRPFNWRRAMREILQEAEGYILRRRRLRRAVLAAHLEHLDQETAQWWATHPEEHQALFKQKLKRAERATKVSTEQKLVRWIG